MASNVPVKYRNVKRISNQSAPGENMLNSTKQQVEGQLHEVKGTAKEKAGEITKDPDLEAEGRTEKVAGIVQKKLGELEGLLGK